MEKEAIIKQIRQILMNDYTLSDMSNEHLADVISQLLEQVTQNQYLTIEERVSISDQVYGSIRGFDILDSILKDESVTEIMVNGPEEIFIEQDGKVTRLEQKFESEQRLEDTIQKIVGLAGREVNQANPIVDTRLPDGSRVNVVLRPISLKGAILTIRKFSKEPMTIEKLLQYKSITPEVAGFLKILVQAKYNILVSGGTGSGKTTFLNALSSFIPRDERVITIEDSAELQIENVDNLVSLETRNANASGAGAVTIQDLIKSSLRMRPDRIIVGECRGAEALDMLQAMNTGHDGSLSTAHANSTKDMLSRLETMVLQGADSLPLDAVRRQIGSAIDIIIQLSRMRDKSRKTLEITEVVGYQNGEIILNPLFVFEESEKSTLEKVDGTLVRTKNKLVNDYKLVMAGKKWN
jgi:pilus assembly protein CpaF